MKYRIYNILPKSAFPAYSPSVWADAYFLIAAAGKAIEKVAYFNEPER